MQNFGAKKEREEKKGRESKHFSFPRENKTCAR